MRRGAFFAIALGMAALAPRPAFGSEPGYAVWFAGQVLSVDVHRGRMRVARGPTETEGRGIEECIVPGTGLKLVRPGMQIKAQADTRHRPWRLLHLRIMERKGIEPDGAAPQVT